MKKYYFLIIVALILGLVLTGCLLSNISQVPATEQSGITYFTKHTEEEPFESILWAGQDINVGTVNVWNDTEDNLYVKYIITDPDWCLTETHLAVATTLNNIPQKNGNPIPGKFSYQCNYDEDAIPAQWVFKIKKGGALNAFCDAAYLEVPCLTEITYIIPLSEIGEGVECEELLYIAAHAVVQNDSVIVGYDANLIPIYWTETAWGDKGKDFPGKNWATYFTYEVQCPCEVSYPAEGNAYIGYEDWPNGDFDYNDFGMYFNAVETYEGGCDEEAHLTKVVMTFTAKIYDSGGNHLIHILRPINGDSEVIVERSSVYVSEEKPAGTYNMTGNVDIVLFDTSKYPQPSKNMSEIVVVTINVANPSLNTKGTLIAPRWDVDPFMANYDPYAVNNEVIPSIPEFDGSEWHIGAWQTVTAVSGGGGRLDTRLVGETLPHVLVVPIAEWIPPYEDTCISGPNPYGPYPYFFDYYNTSGGFHSSWYTEFGYTNVEWGGLSW